MNRLHKFLTYVQLEDAGELSAPMLVFYVAFAVSMVCMLKGLAVPTAVLIAFGVGTVGQTLAEGAKVVQQRQLAKHENEQAIAVTAADATVAVAKVHTDAEDMKAAIAKLAEQVALLATPERVQALKTMAYNKQVTPKEAARIDRL
jgi:hypothetical protein